MKHLILRFGLRELETLCKMKNWTIPSSEDLKKESIEYDEVWVSDLPPDPADRETHGMLWVKGELVLCNKNFKEHSVVIKTAETCANCRHDNYNYQTCKAGVGRPMYEEYDSSDDETYLVVSKTFGCSYFRVKKDT